MQTSTASRGRPQAAAAPCSAPAGWRVKLYELWSEPTGQHTAPLKVIRVGTRACTLRGYPKVVLLDAQGQAIGFRYNHRGDSVVTARPPRAVHLSGAGSTAFFLLNKYRCDYRTTSLARRLWVWLPGVNGKLVYRLPGRPTLDYCPADPPSRTIAVSPIVSRPLQATLGPR